MHCTLSAPVNATDSGYFAYSQMDCNGDLSIYFSSSSSAAIHDTTYLIWMGFIVICIGLGGLLFMTFMGRRK